VSNHPTAIIVGIHNTARAISGFNMPHVLYSSANFIRAIIRRHTSLINAAPITSAAPAASGVVAIPHRNAWASRFLVRHSPVWQGTPPDVLRAGSADPDLIGGPRLFGVVMGRSNSRPRNAGHSHAVDDQTAASLLFLGAHAGVFVVASPSPIFRAADQTCPHRVKVNLLGLFSHRPSSRTAIKKAKRKGRRSFDTAKENNTEGMIARQKTRTPDQFGVRALLSRAESLCKAARGSSSQFTPTAGARSNLFLSTEKAYPLAARDCRRQL
jgi:hypothetical protein